MLRESTHTKMKVDKSAQFLLLLICLVTHHSAAQFMVAQKVTTGHCGGVVASNAVGSYLLTNATACAAALNNLEPTGKPWTITTETAEDWPSGCYLDASNNAWYNSDRSTSSAKTHKCEATNGCYCETVVSATSLPVSSVVTKQIAETDTTTINCEQKHMHSVLRKDVCAAAANVPVAQVTQEHVADAPFGCYIGRLHNKVWLNTDNSDPTKNPNKKCNAQWSKGCICVEPHKALDPCKVANSCASEGKLDNATSTRSCLVTPASEQCTAWAAANPTLLTCARGCKDEPSSSLTADQMEAIYAAKYTAMCTSRL